MALQGHTCSTSKPIIAGAQRKGNVSCLRGIGITICYYKCIKIAATESHVMTESKQTHILKLWVLN